MSSTRLYETSTSGLNFDRFVDRFDESTIAKVRAQYWTAKQLIRKKLGKKEDEYLLASDAEFDAKVNLFKALRATSEQMFVCIDDYQHYLGELTQTEMSLGQMLNDKSKEEVGDTGKALKAVGKVQFLAASYRQKIRAPLIRFMEELRVFSDRAIFDCLSTVEAAERARTEYRGSLLWMKKTSNELDPEAENALEKFRQAQSVVRKNKEKLDGLKMDTLQKVDLLAASRCNLFAQLLGTYQEALCYFYEESASDYAKIYDFVNSCRRYQFEILKDLSEPLEKATGMSEAEEEKAATSTSLIDIEENTGTNVSDPVQTVGAEAEIIDEKRPGPLGFPIEREESPLGEMAEASPDRSAEGTPTKAIGPLPERRQPTAEVPKLTPPPGWKAPDSAHRYTEDLVDLLAQNESNATAESFASEWSKLFAPASAENSSEASGGKTANLPSQLLDVQNSSTTHFPNPFEEPMFADWGKYLKEIDSATQDDSGKGC